MMGPRYIELKQASYEEFEAAQKSGGGDGGDEGPVMSLPWPISTETDSSWSKASSDWETSASSWGKASSKGKAGSKGKRGKTDKAKGKLWEVTKDDPERFELCFRVKEVQRTGDEGKEAWWDFCVKWNKDSRDPVRHPKEMLEEFLKIYEPQFIGGMGGNGDAGGNAGA